MIDLFQDEHQICVVPNFNDLISMPFQGEINAICWKRELVGDFSEIVEKLASTENITLIDEDELFELQLTEQGQLAREILLNDLKLLKAQGAAPNLNIIKCYERDDSFFPTDVYSYHVDGAPIPTSTFLCTYIGEPSEILPNFQAIQKVLVPKIRAELKKLYTGASQDFDAFLSENFFDLHYLAKVNARPINLGLGHLWKLAVQHPESNVPPCIHRAPFEKNGQKRLLLIC